VDSLSDEETRSQSDSESSQDTTSPLSQAIITRQCLPIEEGFSAHSRIGVGYT